MSLYEKLWKLQSAVRGVGKDAKSNSYQYVSGQKLLPIIREQMDKLKLILKQEVTDIENTRQDYRTGVGTQYEKPKSEILSKVKMRFTWVDVETGEKDENDFAANGQNDWEKGLGSALTYGERYFLLKYFHIPTDEDDIDNPERKPEDRQAAKQQQTATQPSDNRKVLPKDKFNNEAFLKWIKDNVGIPTFDNIQYLLEKAFRNLTKNDIKEIYENFNSYEQRITANQPANAN